MGAYVWSTFNKNEFDDIRSMEPPIYTRCHQVSLFCPIQTLIIMM